MNFTAPKGDTPEGFINLTGLRDIQNLTEDDIIRKLNQPLNNAVADARNSFFTSLRTNVFQPLRTEFLGAMSTMAGDFTDRLTSLSRQLWAEILGLEKKVADGQEALNNRVDLLSPLLDYGSAYMGSVNGIFNTGIMPFTNQIGPLRGVEMTANGFKLLDKGLWDIRAQITASWVATVFVPTVRWRVRVTAPNGTLYSEQTATLTDSNLMTQTIVSSVVVPEPGYLVQVEVQTMTTGRGMMGGPRWNRLTVQHISRNVDGHTGAEQSQSA